jgi:nucleotide-binding universal stress UspA family protein
MTVKPLVAATDGSDESLQAIEWAAREAVLRSAPLRIVAAASPPPRMLNLLVRPGRDLVAGLIREERDRALAAAAARAAEVAPGLQVDTVPLAGPPAQVVTESGSGASMLVLAAHGTGALGSIALGSVSWYAAAHASCPVVIVRGETTAVHRKIGIGIGDPDASTEPLTFAFDEASLRQADLIAVHAWLIPPAAISRAGSPSPVPDLAATVAEAARRLAGLLDNWRAMYPEVTVSQYVVRDRPSWVLVGLSIRTDLVVIGRHASQPGPPGPGSVGHAVLNRAPGSVAVVPSS